MLRRMSIDISGTKMDELTKEQVLARVSNAFDMGLMGRKQMQLLERWLDFVNRFEGGQMSDVANFIEQEQRRTANFHRTLAGDHEGYGLVKLAAILSHQCQACAEDSDAWHTRSAFCPHSRVSDGHGDDDDGC